MGKKMCEVCGKEFQEEEGRPSRWCSAECYAKLLDASNPSVKLKGPKETYTSDRRLPGERRS